MAGPDVVRVKAVAVDSCYSAVGLAVQQQLQVAAVVSYLYQYAMNCDNLNILENEIADIGAGGRLAITAAG